jgi:hypothetical protein
LPAPFSSAASASPFASLILLSHEGIGSGTTTGEYGDGCRALMPPIGLLGLNAPLASAVAVASAVAAAAVAVVVLCWFPGHCGLCAVAAIHTRMSSTSDRVGGDVADSGCVCFVGDLTLLALFAVASIAAICDLDDVSLSHWRVSATTTAAVSVMVALTSGALLLSAMGGGGGLLGAA